MSVKNLILNKLKSKKGSALLLAMLFSLMCIILGMVVLSAGEVSNGRIVNAAKAEQSYYIASSLFREFQQEAQYTYTDAFNQTITEGMTLRVNTYAGSGGFGNSGFRYENAFTTGSDNKNQLTTLRPFIARGLYEAMKSGSYSNDLTFELGGGEGALSGTTYTAVVRMTISSADYSIYLDVTDVYKGTVETGENLGAPHLDTIAIQCRRITPKAASGGNLTDAIFEYDQARLLH